LIEEVVVLKALLLPRTEESFAEAESQVAADSFRDLRVALDQSEARVVELQQVVASTTEQGDQALAMVNLKVDDLTVNFNWFLLGSRLRRGRPLYYSTQSSSK
jgi:hypothetical protein